MTDLTTLDKVHQLGKFTVNGTLQTADDPLIEDVLIPAASEMIENHCQVTFSLANGTMTLDAAPPFLYGDRLFFRQNDAAGVYQVTTDTGTLQSADYDLMPLNGPPYTGLRLRQGVQWNVSDWRAAIKVAGTLGYSADVPSDVSYVATRLVWWMYQNRDNDGSIMVVDNVKQIPSDAPPLVFKVLQKYVKSQVYG